MKARTTKRSLKAQGQSLLGELLNAMTPAPAVAVPPPSLKRAKRVPKFRSPTAVRYF